MEHHGPLSLSLDDKLYTTSFADDLISEFDSKRDLLYTLTDIHPGSNNNDGDVPIITPSLHSTTPTRLASVSRTNHSEDDNHLNLNLNFDENSASNVSPAPPPQPQPESSSLEQTSPMLTSDAESLPPKYLMPSPPPPAANPTRQNNSGLLRRSSTFLRQKFLSAAHTTTKPHPPIPTTTHITQQTTSNTSDDDDTTTTTTTTTTATTTTRTAAPLPANQIGDSDRTVHRTAPASPPPPPCQYPPKPLSYCPVDPPTDDHPRRTSFPTLASWRKKSIQDPRRQSEPTVTPTKGRRSFFF